MNTINLTADYIELVLKQQNHNAYQKSYPTLFDHYYQYWADKKYLSKTYPETNIIKKTDLIIGRTNFIEKKFKEAGFNITNLDVVFFVGQGTSNGHAFEDKGKYVVWIPVESYSTPLLVDVFLTHEIIHSLHYANTPEFYFRNRIKKDHFSRQLITEGVATYLTMKILGTTELSALWADYLSEYDAEKWLEACQSKESELSKYALNNYSLSNPKHEFFQANDPNDIFKFRAGYYLGLRLISKIIKLTCIEIESLLQIPRLEFEKLVIDQLKR